VYACFVHPSLEHSLRVFFFAGLFFVSCTTTTVFDATL
jgi:hypothetical protein